MFFSRVYSFFFLMLSFGMMASAKPVDTTVVARTYPANPTRKFLVLNQFLVPNLTYPSS